MTRRLFSLVALGVALVVVQASTFAAPVPVSGIVVDSTGAPVPNVHVSVIRETRTLPDGGWFDVIGRAVSDRQGRFSLSAIDPDKNPKILNPDVLTIKTDPNLHCVVGMDDGRERAVQSVDVTTDKKDNVVQSVSLKITVR